MQYWSGTLLSVLNFIRLALFVPAILVIGFSGLAEGQSVEAKLKQPVDSFASQSASTIEQLVELAQRFSLPMGIEWVDEPDLQNARPIELRETTVQDAVQQILQPHSGYDFAFSDGVVHVFNRSMLDDSRNFLNIRFPEFGFKDESLSVGSW